LCLVIDLASQIGRLLLLLQLILSLLPSLATVLSAALGLCTRRETVIGVLFTVTVPLTLLTFCFELFIFFILLVIFILLGPALALLPRFLRLLSARLLFVLLILLLLFFLLVILLLRFLLVLLLLLPLYLLTGGYLLRGLRVGLALAGGWVVHLLDEHI